jgi:hypothetical protein
MKNIGIFYSHFGIFRPFVIFLAVWYVSWSFGAYFPVVVCFSKKNLATLLLFQRRLSLQFILTSSPKPR